MSDEDSFWEYACPCGVSPDPGIKPGGGCWCTEDKAAKQRYLMHYAETALSKCEAERDRLAEAYGDLVNQWTARALECNALRETAVACAGALATTSVSNGAIRHAQKLLRAVLDDGGAAHAAPTEDPQPYA